MRWPAPRAAAGRAGCSIIAGSAAGLAAGAAAGQLVDRLQHALGGSTSPARPAPAAPGTRDRLCCVRWPAPRAAAGRVGWCSVTAGSAAGLAAGAAAGQLIGRLQRPGRMHTARSDQGLFREVLRSVYYCNDLNGRCRHSVKHHVIRGDHDFAQSRDSIAQLVQVRMLSQQ